MAAEAPGDAVTWRLAAPVLRSAGGAGWVLVCPGCPERAGPRRGMLHPVPLDRFAAEAVGLSCGSCGRWKDGVLACQNWRGSAKIIRTGAFTLRGHVQAAGRTAVSSGPAGRALRCRHGPPKRLPGASRNKTAGWPPATSPGQPARCRACGRRPPWPVMMDSGPRAPRPV
jgi:hypothetical protein